MKKKINYSIGDIFLVPLRTNGYCVGVIIKMNNQGSVLGYFLNFRVTNSHEINLANINDSNIIFKCLFGDLGLINKEWLIAKDFKAPSELFQLEINGFVRKVDSLYYLTEYDDLLNIISEKVLNTINPQNDYIENSLYGYGAVELKLSTIIL